MNKKSILNKAIERGYNLHNYSGDHLRYNFIREDGIGLILYPETEEFKIYYNIDFIATLQGEKCGSFMNDKHFNSIESKFIKYVYILKNNMV